VECPFGGSSKKSSSKNCSPTAGSMQHAAMAAKQLELPEADSKESKSARG